jgi:hypothetical protein
MRHNRGELVVDLADMRKRVVYGAFFRFALMLFEIGQELFFGLVRVGEKLLTSAKRQLADVAVRRAGSGADESHNLEPPVGHGEIIILPGVETSQFRTRAFRESAIVLRVAQARVFRNNCF